MTIPYQGRASTKEESSSKIYPIVQIQLYTAEILRRAAIRAFLKKLHILALGDWTNLTSLIHYVRDCPD